jgi:hypothetical protein
VALNSPEITLRIIRNYWDEAGTYSRITVDDHCLATVAVDCSFSVDYRTLTISSNGAVPVSLSLSLYLYPYPYPYPYLYLYLVPTGYAGLKVTASPRTS